MIKILRSACLLVVWLGITTPSISLAQNLVEFCKGLLNRRSATPVVEVVGPPTWIETFNLEWKRQQPEFSRSQIKHWSEAMEHLTEDLVALEKNQSPNVKSQAVHDQLRRALEKLPLIYEAWQGLKTEDRNARYFKDTYQAVWAALSVHSHEIMDGSAHLDYERYFKIMRMISEFDSKNPKFSFYKIRRAIEGRFHMRDFVQCKKD